MDVAPLYAAAGLLAGDTAGEVGSPEWRRFVVDAAGELLALARAEEACEWAAQRSTVVRFVARIESVAQIEKGTDVIVRKGLVTLDSIAEDGTNETIETPLLTELQGALIYRRALALVGNRAQLWRENRPLEGTKRTVRELVKVAPL